MGQPGEWLSDVHFWVSDAPSAGSAGGQGGDPPGAGQGFSLSRDEALSMLVRARGVCDELRALQRKAEQLTQMQAPADEPASKGYNSAGNGAFGYGSGHIHKEIEYLSELISRLERALGITAQGDEDAAADMKRTTAGLGGLVG
ncbi:hypothetical protein AB5J62_15040 [Amycolatopsis sp. cg5]|uniref:hypothetical protein n=1 Tax=Amycolatopsis sp. cg5 TaxID=3238802 RepID=UPI00352398E1